MSPIRVLILAILSLALASCGLEKMPHAIQENERAILASSHSIRENQRVVNESTDAIAQNQSTIEHSTQAIARNKEAVERLTPVLEKAQSLLPAPHHFPWLLALVAAFLLLALLSLVTLALAALRINSALRRSDPRRVGLAPPSNTSRQH